MMKWRPIGASGAYPEWLRALRDRHGVYAIRKRGWFSPTVLYVGESHTGLQVARTPAAALSLQAKWIARLKPRDNRAGVELEDAPF
jgi:hypothetical protein